MLYRISCMQTARGALPERAKKGKKGKGKGGPAVGVKAFDLNQWQEAVEGEKRDLEPPWVKEGAEKPEWFKKYQRLDSEGLVSFPSSHLDPHSKRYAKVARRNKILTQNWLMRKNKFDHLQRKGNMTIFHMLQRLGIRHPGRFYRDTFSPERLAGRRDYQRYMLNIKKPVYYSAEQNIAGYEYKSCEIPIPVPPPGLPPSKNTGKNTNQKQGKNKGQKQGKKQAAN